MRDRLKQLPPVALVILGTILAIVLLAVFKPSAPTRDVSERHDRYVLYWPTPAPIRPRSSFLVGCSHPVPPV